MDEMMQYIFGALRRSDKIIAKTLREQKSFNRSVKLFAVLITANTIALKFENSKMRSDIDTLKNEIKELRTTKEGE